MHAADTYGCTNHSWLLNLIITGLNKTAHSPPRQGNTGYVKITGAGKIKATDVPTVTNEWYHTSHLPLPSRAHQQQQDMQLTQNKAYVTSMIPVKRNECYGTTATPMDSDQIYANSTYNPQQLKKEDYDYIIP